MNLLTSFLVPKTLKLFLIFSLTSLFFYLYEVNVVQPKAKVKELKAEKASYEVNATVTKENHEVQLENVKNETISENRKEILKNENASETNYDNDSSYLDGVFLMPKRDSL